MNTRKHLNSHIYWIKHKKKTRIKEKTNENMKNTCGCGKIACEHKMKQSEANEPITTQDWPFKLYIRDIKRENSEENTHSTD